MMQAIKKLYNFVQQNLFCKIVTYFLVFAPIVICMEKGTSVKKVIIPGASEPSDRTLRATIPENESQPNFLILI